MDQAGHYYYQAKGETQQVMTMVPGISESNSEETEEFIINNETEEDGNQEEEEEEEAEEVCRCNP